MPNGLGPSILVSCPRAMFACAQALHATRVPNLVYACPGAVPANHPACLNVEGTPAAFLPAYNLSSPHLSVCTALLMLRLSVHNVIACCIVDCAAWIAPGVGELDATRAQLERLASPPPPAPGSIFSVSG